MVITLDVHNTSTFSTYKTSFQFSFVKIFYVPAKLSKVHFKKENFAILVIPIIVEVELKHD